jgi:hypothetical protein
MLMLSVQASGETQQPQPFKAPDTFDFRRQHHERGVPAHAELFSKTLAGKQLPRSSWLMAGASR